MVGKAALTGEPSSKGVLMKTKVIGAATVAILSLTVPVAFAGHGGGHGGGGFAGGGHVSGGRGYSGSMPGYSGGMRSYSGGVHSYGTLRGYTGGGLGRVYTGYGQSRQPTHAPIYSGRATSQIGANNRHSYSSQKFYGQSFSGSRAAVNRTDRVVSGSQHSAYGNRATQRGIKEGFVSKQGVTAHNGKTGQGNWARNNPKNRNHFDQQTQNKLRNWQGNKSSWAEAKQRHRDNHDGHHDGRHNGNHHDHNWWRHHYTAVVWVDWGWWGWWDGWWYPAWGYDPYYYYSYDEPIYGYGGLPPDEIVANVQSQLQQLGYFSYAVDGVMGPLTKEAIMRYQRDQRLPITGAIDSATVGSLGLGS